MYLGVNNIHEQPIPCNILRNLLKQNVSDFPGWRKAAELNISLSLQNIVGININQVHEAHYRGQCEPLWNCLLYP
jgi:hypothetical protein